MLAVLVLVLVLFVLVLVLFVPAVVVLTVLAVLVLVCSRLIAGTFCAASGPTRASSSSVASIARGAPCWRRWVVMFRIFFFKVPCVCSS